MGRSAQSRKDNLLASAIRGSARRGFDRGNMFDIFIFISLIMRAYIVFQR